jgi:hypothetical protein
MFKAHMAGCLVLIAAVLLTFDDAPSAPPEHDPVGSVTILTRNLYYGANLSPLTSLPAPVDGAAFFEMMLTVESVMAEIVGSNYPARAAVLAEEIAASQPTLVGLQEVATFTEQAFDFATLLPIEEEAVILDFLDILLDELDDLGLHYKAVVVAPGTDATLPGLGRYLRMIDHEVILARTDLPAADLKLSNPQWDVFENAVTFETGGTVVPLYRSWASIDAKVRGREFRLITTHLNVEGDNIQLAQTLELLDGPANTDLPVVMIGDYNSAAAGAVDGTIWSFPPDAYNALLDAGFEDAWDIAHPNVDGFTVGQDYFLNNEESLASTRIDVIMFREGTKRGRFRVRNAGLVGDEPDFITEATIVYPDGSQIAHDILWPSDHVGLFATLQALP